MEHIYFEAQLCSETSIFNEKRSRTFDRSEGFPERDIWFLGVMVQGSGLMGELLRHRISRHRQYPVPSTPNDTKIQKKDSKSSSLARM